MISIGKNAENKFELYDTSSGLRIFDEAFDEVQSFGNLFVVIKGELKSIIHISGKPLIKSLTCIQIDVTIQLIPYFMLKTIYGGLQHKMDATYHPFVVQLDTEFAMK